MTITKFHDAFYSIKDGKAMYQLVHTNGYWLILSGSSRIQIRETLQDCLDYISTIGAQS